MADRADKSGGGTFLQRPPSIRQVEEWQAVSSKLHLRVHLQQLSSRVKVVEYKYTFKRRGSSRVQCARLHASIDNRIPWSLRLSTGRAVQAWSEINSFFYATTNITAGSRTARKEVSGHLHAQDTSGWRVRARADLQLLIWDDSTWFHSMVPFE